MDQEVEVDDHDRADIREILRWSPSERIDHLIRMLEFEAQAAEARPVG